MTRKGGIGHLYKKLPVWQSLVYLQVGYYISEPWWHQTSETRPGAFFKIYKLQNTRGELEDVECKEPSNKVGGVFSKELSPFKIHLASLSCLILVLRGQSLLSRADDKFILLMENPSHTWPPQQHLKHSVHRDDRKTDLFTLFLSCQPSLVCLIHFRSLLLWTLTHSCCY